MKRIAKTVVKIVLIGLGGIFFLLLAIVLLFQIPQVQQFGADKATGYLSGKIKSVCTIQRLYIQFPSKIVLEGLYAEDLNKDTLLYVRKLETDLAMLDLLDGKLSVGNFSLEGVNANIIRTLPDSSFNFDFILKAFAGPKKDQLETLPDSNSKPLKIELNTILLKDIRLVYDDAVTGTLANAQLGELSLKMEETDFRNMRFKGDELMLSNSTGFFDIRKPSSNPDEPSSDSPLPELALRKINLKAVNFGFHNLPDSSYFDFRMGQISIEPKTIDLNKENIELKTVLIHQSDIRISMQEKPQNPKADQTISSSQNQWKASIDRLDLDKNHFQYDRSNVPVLRSGIDYNHLELDQLHLTAKNLKYTPQIIQGQIEQLSLLERCGLKLEKFETQFEYDSTHARLENLFVKTDKSRITAHLSIAYPSISSLSTQIENLEMHANLDSCRISMKDVLQFAPDLIRQPIIQKNKDRIFLTDGIVDGLLSNLRVQKLDVQTATNTRISLSGQLKGLPDPNRLTFQLRLNKLVSSRSDLNQLLPADMLPNSVRIPDRFSVKGIAKGRIKNWNTDLQISGSDGDADVVAALSTESREPKYSSHLVLRKFNAGRILKQEPTLGRVSGSFDVKGESFDPQKISAQIEGEIKSLETKDYTYRNAQFSAWANWSLYETTVSIRDTNLYLTLNGNASLKKDSGRAHVDLTLYNANLQALRLYNEDLQASGQLKADVQNFDPEKMTGKLSLKNLMVVKEGQKIEMDSLVATLKNEAGVHSMVIKSDVLDLDYNGNHSVVSTIPALQNHLNVQMGNAVPKSDSANQEFQCSIALKPHRMLKEAFLPELKQFNGLSFESHFASRDKILDIQVGVPFIQYGENIVKDLQVKVNGKGVKTDYDLSVQNFQNGNIMIPKSQISGKLEKKILDFGLAVSHPDSGERLHVSGSIDQQTANETVLRLTGNSLTLNNEKWAIPSGNAVRFVKGGINIQGLGLEKDGQMMSAQSKNAQPDSEINIHFRNFELGTISRIIEKDTALVRGQMDGDVRIKKISPFGFTSDLAISNISFREIPVGNLSLKADNLVANRYSASVILSGDSNDVKLKGYYESEKVDLNVDIQQVRMKSLEAFASKYIRKCSGYFSGGIRITGKATEPKMNGKLTFHNAGMNLVAINNTVLLKNETIQVSNEGIHFADFTVLDPKGQPMNVKGDVLSSNFTDMKFNLDITTRNFTVMNTTAKDNPVYYGTLILNSTLKIRGDQNLPVLTANGTLLDNSTFTFVVLEGDLSTSRGEDVVVFEDSVRVRSVTSKDTVRMKTEYKGIDLNANIEVNKNSVFRVIVDPESGDNLEVSGDANLAFGIDPGGKVSLSGVYILNDGHYQASFQKVIKREFKIKTGSRITWSGDPMDGQIDLTAIYKTQAGATDLMANELAGVSENERIAYRKLLTYYVNLIINGPILKPQLQFNLDMPPADQLAFGGLVYAKVNMLNTDPNELNKQVFSLLVLNKFIPTGSAGVSTGSAVSTLARNSVNQMLTDQLNVLSGRYVKGAAINFNLQTTEDYNAGAAQQNTALQVGVKKELFNSRLSLQVGSSIDLSGSKQNTSNSNGQSLTGDVQVEYKLTPDGRLRLKAFRENQYEGVIDGILYKTGLGFSYTRDYNYFRELWKSPHNETKP